MRKRKREGRELEGRDLREGQGRVCGMRGIPCRGVMGVGDYVCVLVICKMAIDGNFFQNSPV